MVAAGRIAAAMDDTMRWDERPLFVPPGTVRCTSRVVFQEKHKHSLGSLRVRIHPSFVYLMVVVVVHSVTVIVRQSSLGYFDFVLCLVPLPDGKSFRIDESSLHMQLIKNWGEANVKKKLMFWKFRMIVLFYFLSIWRRVVTDVIRLSYRIFGAWFQFEMDA